jgi:integrase
MAWIVEVPPSPRHAKTRWQVRYQDGNRERSAGIHPTEPAAQAVKRRIERGSFSPDALEVTEETASQQKALTLFGDYVTTTWWPRWRDNHPHSAYLYGKRIEKRILPAFGNLRFIELDADRIGDWKAKMIAEGLAAQTINAYLSLLGTILNAAVDSDYLPRSPMRRRSGAGRVEAAKHQKAPRREVWLTRAQLDRLAGAISSRYRALVLAAALTGLRWGELAALRWDDLQLVGRSTTARWPARGGCGSCGPSATRPTVVAAR